MCPPAEDPTELARFRELQRRLAPHYASVFPDRLKPRTVVVIPSLTLDPEELAKITGVHHYEERMLCMLMLLRLPRTHVIYVTSQPLAPSVIDYFLHLLSGVPSIHARRRLHLFSCHDSSNRSLTEKLLERPRLIERVRAAIGDPSSAHMACFNATPLERTLAVRLGLPLYACDPGLAWLGSKSGSRAMFREAGIDLPDGIEDLSDAQQVVGGLSELKRRNPDLRRAVVKLNDGFSGEGNALLEFTGAPDGAALEAWVRDELPRRLAFEARAETWEHYRCKLDEMGGVVECFVEGADKRSPSVQCRITPDLEPVVISTHDQVLGGPSGQVFLGCTFPADAAYRLEIQEAGLKVARVLANRAAIGRMGVDFVSVPTDSGWRHYAIEINLRKGGTTHPFMMLKFLTDGRYEPATGEFRLRSGEPRYYYASDNLQSDAYRGLTPEDLIDITVCQDLHFHGATQEGVVFHLISTLSEFGKLGMVCIADSPAQARLLYDQAVSVLDRASGA